MGTWNKTSPDGTKSVKENVTIQQNNTDYLKDNLKLDHFWDESDSKDGYHKQINMPKLDADPTTLPADIDGQFYYRSKDSNESPDLQKVEPFHYSIENSNNHYMQMGFRCLVSFRANSNFTPTQNLIHYYHNINLQSDSPAGVVYNSTGKFTINFKNPLPTNKYIVTGSAVPTATGANGLNLGILKTGTLTNSKDKDFVKITFTRTDTGAFENPFEAMIMICGG